MTKKIKNKRNVFLLLFCFLLFLSGCTERTIVNMHEDGSVERTTEFTLNKAVLKKIFEYDIENEKIKNNPEIILAPLAEGYTKFGFQKELLSNDEIIGYRFYKKYDTPGAYNKDTPAIYEAKLSGLNGEIYFNKNAQETVYIFNGDFQYLYDDDVTPFKDNLPNIEDIIPLSAFKSTLIVNYPGTLLRKTPGFSGESKTAIITVDYDITKDTQDIYPAKLMSNILNPNYQRNRGFKILGTIIVVGIIGIIFSRLLKDRKKKKKKKESLYQ